MAHGFSSMSGTICRSRSEPSSLSRHSDKLLFGKGCIDLSPLHTAQDKSSPPPNCPRKYSQFFPEAIGSGQFIERNGHLSMLSLLKTLGTLMERCSVVRVSEVVRLFYIFFQ